MDNNIAVGSYVDLNTVSVIALYTGNHERRECTCNCIGCYFSVSELVRKPYQGNSQQIFELIKILPNLKKVLIFGNPDISVDVGFCNEASVIFQQHDIEVCFCTSGIGGINVLKDLFRGLDSKLVRFVDFSIDSIDENVLSEIKGIKYPLSVVVEEIDYCNSLGIATGVRPTIWEYNKNEDWHEYRKFFEELGVSRFIMHFGSVENTNKGISHVSEEEVRRIRNEYSDAGSLPFLFLSDEEFVKYSIEYKPRCWSGNGLLVLSLADGEIKASAVCNVLTAVFPELIVDLSSGKVPLVAEHFLECPVADKALGYVSTAKHKVCRYYRFDHKLNLYTRR